MNIKNIPITMPPATSKNTPAIFVIPSVLGEVSSSSHDDLFERIHSVSKLSILPFSCNCKIDRDNLFSHGFPFRNANF